MGNHGLIPTEQLETPDRTQRPSSGRGSSVLALLDLLSRRSGSRCGARQAGREEEGGPIRGRLDGVAEQVGQGDLAHLRVGIPKEGH